MHIGTDNCLFSSRSHVSKQQPGQDDQISTPKHSTAWSSVPERSIAHTLTGCTSGSCQNPKSIVRFVASANSTQVPIGQSRANLLQMSHRLLPISHQSLLSHHLQPTFTLLTAYSRLLTFSTATASSGTLPSSCHHQGTFESKYRSTVWNKITSVE